MFIHDQCFDVYADTSELNKHFYNVEVDAWYNAPYLVGSYEHIRMFCAC